jgi:purine-binding chemotaxis protein CheW
VDAVHVRLHGERYAIDVANVVEVEQRDTVTPVWGAPPLVTGVRNLRGSVLPVLDLAVALGLPARPDPPYVVVVECGSVCAGLGVDGVMDVEPVPAVLQPADRHGLAGHAMAGDELIGVIDVEAVLGMATPA